MKKWVLGITGGIGSGKSTIVRLFVEKGIEAIDADYAARLVVSKDSPALDQIHEHFGSDILLSDGNLNRSALRNIVFNTPGQRQWLEQLLHPLIHQKIVNFLDNASSPYAILVSPLLIETNQTQLVNRILVIDTPEQLQIERCMARDHCTEQQVKAIMQTQLSRTERLQYAQDVIYNDGSINNLAVEIDQLHQRYLALSQQKSYE